MSTAGPVRVLVVGLGTIAQTHLAVLASRDDAAVVAGVDPRGSDAGIDVFPDLGSALAAGLEPGLVVVATPTGSHPEVVRAVLDGSDARVLSEKPLAATAAGVDGLLAARPDVGDRVAVAHHFAFSPEVAWARDVVAQHPQWGPPIILSVFNDPYGDRLEDRRTSLVSSWVDSGPNQLSLLSAFGSGWEVVAHEDHGHSAATTLSHAGGEAVLSSSWLAADSSKQTSLRFLGGDVEVRMDHTSMTGLVVEAGRVTARLDHTSGLGRKEAHYSGLYDVLLADPADERLGVALARDIARVLESALS